MMRDVALDFRLDCIPHLLRLDILFTLLLLHQGLVWNVSMAKWLKHAIDASNKLCPGYTMR
jgi:hypothetical protein